VVKARGAENLVMNFGRSWRASWVCHEGRVDRAGSTMRLGTSLAGRCYLGVPHEKGTCGEYM
jgi:hypothetical protein